MGMNARVDAVLNVLSEAGADVATAFTCTEAEVIADLFREVGRVADADRWIEQHGWNDDEGDSHYWDGEGENPYATKGEGA